MSLKRVNEMVVCGGNTMKGPRVGKCVTLLAMVVVLLGASVTAHAGAKARSIIFYVGNGNSTAFNNATPNGLGGTVSLSYNCNISWGGAYTSCTSVTIDASSGSHYNGWSQTFTKNRGYITFAPGSGYKIATAKYVIMKSGTVPDAATTWNPLVNTATGALNQTGSNTYYYNIGSSSKYTQQMFVWIYFQSTTTIYGYVSDLFPDIPVNSSYSACWKLVSLAGPTNPADQTTPPAGPGTYKTTTTLTPPRSQVAFSPYSSIGHTYPSVFIDNITTDAQAPPIKAADHANHTKFWFKLVAPTDTTDSGCELDSISFNGDAYANPPLEGTLAIDGTPVSGSVLSGSYTPPSFSTDIADAAVIFKFRHKGFYLSTSVDSNGTYPQCGSSTDDLVVPPGQDYFPVGATPSFVVTAKPGCAISTVKIQNETYDTGTGTFATLGSPTDVTSQLVNNTYMFPPLTNHANLIVSFIPVSTATASTSYCQLPAFMGGVTPTKPNVLLVFDTSGSMGDKPYQSQTYTCRAPTTPANGFQTLDKCTNFYGYFDKTIRYNLDTSIGVWVPQGGATNFGPLSGNTGISGNYLNYLHMRKVDIVRKILIGGLVDNVDGKARSYDTANSNTYYVLDANDGTEVQTGTTPTNGTSEPTGLIQQVYSKVRLGIMTYNPNPQSISSSLDSDGGALITSTMPDGTDKVATLGASLNVLINSVEDSSTNPAGNTPLAETLYEAIRYYEAQPSAYNSVNGDGTGGTLDYGTMDPVLSSCQKHFVILLTDGQPTSDTNLPFVTGHSSTRVDDSNMTTWLSGLTASGLPTPVSPLAKVAYYAHNNDLRSATVGNSAYAGTQNLTIFSVYVFGDGSGTATLQETAMYGSYTNEFAPPYSTTVSHNNKPDPACSSPSTGCPPQSEYAGGYYEASDGSLLAAQLQQALSIILSSTASGTAAAVANNKSGERGANIIKAVFYPQWPNDSTIKWLGEVMSLWYYLDPVISYSAIFEDTGASGDKILDTLVNPTPNSNPALIKPLWSAGSKLQAKSADSRNIYTLLGSTATGTDLTSSHFFSTANVATLKPLLNLSTLPSDNVQVGKLINYVRGTDTAEYRSRKVTLTGNVADALVWKLGDVINSTPQVQTSVAINAYDSAYSDTSYSQFISSNQYKSRSMVYSGSNDGMLHGFKAGVVTAIHDTAHPTQYAKMTIDGTEGQEQWAFIPFNVLPYLQNQADVSYCHQCLVDGAPSVVDASINKPTGCTATNYWDCARKTTVSAAGVMDADQTSWKTVLVGSMGLGGATRLSGGNCNITDPTQTAAASTDCVKSPMTDNGLSSYFALDVTDPGTPKYLWEFSDNSIALAADKGLGFTTSGPSILRINSVGSPASKPDRTKNGRWFAVFASGPTGMIDTSYEFTGRSDQNLKLYIVDLNSTLPFVKGTNYWVKDTGIPFAFANSIVGASLDLDRWNSLKDSNYSDDVLYVTYTKASLTNYTGTLNHGSYPASASMNYSSGTDSTALGTATSPTTTDPLTNTTAWNKGGVLRLVTNHNPDPSTWFTSILIDNIGPVTTGVGKLQDRANNKLWVFFGEGRYFYPQDDINHTRRFYGVADPCYKQYTDSSISANLLYTGDDYTQYAMGIGPGTTYPTANTSCPAVTGPAVTDSYSADVSGIDLQRVDTPATTLTDGKKGWYINMATASGASGAERVVSDVSASLNGLVFFTTYIPTIDPCTPGGSTSMWAVKYDTGGTPPSGSLIGKAPLQTSSGGISIIDLATSFTQNSSRKLSGALSPVGMTPKGKFPQLLQPKATKQILNIQER